MFSGVLILVITIQIVINAETASQSQDCYLPKLPTLGDLLFRLHPLNNTLELGAIVKEYESVHIECKNGKVLMGASSLFCSSGEWSGDFPVCDNYCDGKLLDRLSLRAICNYNDEFVKCPQKIPTGTLIQVKCSFYYYRDPNRPQYLRCLPNGSFDKTPQRCEPYCGRAVAPVTALSKHGIEMQTSVAPWHVAIYRGNDVQYNYYCAGSIISPTVVISVAHCFWDEANQQLHNSTNFLVIAGSSSRNYTPDQIEYTQRSKLQEVHIPEEYQGRSHHQMDDIALLILAKPFKYSETIAPVCYPKTIQNSASSYMPSGLNGFISIFEKNNELENIAVKTNAYHDCATAGELAADKFCIYAANTTRDVSWRGNSGAGFTTTSHEPFTDNVIYNLRGILSHGMYSKDTQTVDRVAVTNIYTAPASFQRKVLGAIKNDELLI